MNVFVRRTYYTKQQFVYSCCVMCYCVGFSSAIILYFIQLIIAICIGNNIITISGVATHKKQQYKRPISPFKLTAIKILIDANIRKIFPKTIIIFVCFA